jgi:hypothetical protein
MKSVECVEILDRLKIGELYSRYALANDEEDLLMLAECFAEDARFVSGIPDVPDRYGIKDIQARLIQRHQEKRFRERHLITNPVIRKLTTNRAEASAEVAIFHCENGRTKLKMVGRYDDVLEKRAGRWLFVQRTFLPDV